MKDRGKHYKVQYISWRDNDWHTIPGCVFDNKADAEKKAEACKRGFGETRVICQSWIKTR